MYKFLCHICEKEFVSSKYLDYHLKACQDGIYDFSCNKCAYKTNNRRYFIIHQQIHDMVKHECSICQLQLGSESALKGHKKRLHSNIEKKYVCDLCGNAFIKQKELENHSKIHTNNEDSEEKCEHCEYKTWSKLYMTRHKLTHFPEKRDLKFQCHSCDYKTWSRKKLTRHMNVHITLELVKCNLCPKIYKHKEYLRVHQQISHQGATKKFKCLVEGCDKSFPTNSQLSSHTLRHSKVDKDKFCPECGKGFKFQKDVNDHLKIHTDPIKKFDCDQCDKQFRTDPHLRRHKKVHQGISLLKEFKCLVCGSEFGEKYNLRQHQKEVHEKDGIRFQCEKCPKRFHRKADLAYHLEMQHSGQSHEVQCSICDKKYSHPKLMRQHKRVVHVDPTHECTQCQSKFKLKSKLNRHIKSVHNKDS